MVNSHSSLFSLPLDGVLRQLNVDSTLTINSTIISQHSAIRVFLMLRSSTNNHTVWLNRSLSLLIHEIQRIEGCLEYIGILMP
jgi:hypothetical protein